MCCWLVLREVLIYTNTIMIEKQLRHPISKIWNLQLFGLLLLVTRGTGELVWTDKSCTPGTIRFFPGSCTSYANCETDAKWDEVICPPGFMLGEDITDCVPGECMPPPVPEILGQPCEVAGSTEVVPYACDAYAVCTSVMESLVWVEEKCEPGSCPFWTPCPPYPIKTVVLGEPCEAPEMGWNAGFVENRCDIIAFCDTVGDSNMTIWVEDACEETRHTVYVEDDIYCYPGKCHNP